MRSAATRSSTRPTSTTTTRVVSSAGCCAGPATSDWACSTTTWAGWRLRSPTCGRRRAGDAVTGGRGWDRTSGLCRVKAALVPLSYAPRWGARTIPDTAGSLRMRQSTCRSPRGQPQQPRRGVVGAQLFGVVVAVRSGPLAASSGEWEADPGVVHVGWPVRVRVSTPTWCPAMSGRRSFGEDHAAWQDDHRSGDARICAGPHGRRGAGAPVPRRERVARPAPSPGRRAGSR